MTIEEAKAQAVSYIDAAITAARQDGLKQAHIDNAYAAIDVAMLAVLDEARFQDCGECAEEDYLALRTFIKELER